MTWKEKYSEGDRLFFGEVVLNEAFHGRLHDLTQLQLKRMAKLCEHIPEMPGHAAHEVYGQCPGFGVFVQVGKKEITEAVFNDIFNHEVAAVGAKKGRK
jgi:hypothetical protein